MSDVLRRLKECLKTFGYIVDEVERQLEFKAHTIQGKSYPCIVEERSPNTNVIQVSTLYFPPPQPNWDKQQLQKYIDFLKRLLRETGAGFITVRTQ